MLGHYDNFPENIHKITSFSTSTSKKRLQQALIQVLHKINKEKFTLEDVAHPSIPHCKVIFEFGIAEANNFNYLDSEEKSRTIKKIRKKPFQTMDFLCAMRYYKMQNEKKTPLRFDYYLLRFTFNKKLAEIQIFHERGPRHMTPEDAVNFVANNINEAFSKNVLKTL